MNRDADILKKAQPCPFCGSTKLAVVEWCDETGEYPAVECAACFGASPATTWNSRAMSTMLPRFARGGMVGTDPPAVEAGESLDFGLR